MRKILGLKVAFLFASAALAQDRHFPAALGSGLPPLRTTAPRAAPPRGPRSPMGAGYGGNYAGGYGGYGGGFWGGFDYGGYAPAPSEPAPAPVVNNIQFDPPPVFVPPPPPIRSSIQDFKPAASTAPPAFYVIALKDGKRVDAAAVWVQGNDVHYVDSDDQNHRASLTDIDRTATRELNQARNLNLRLPPPAQ